MNRIFLLFKPNVNIPLIFVYLFIPIAHINLNIDKNKVKHVRWHLTGFIFYPTFQ